MVKKLYMMSPIVLLVYMLLAGYTPMYSAVAGIATAWGASLFTPGKRMGPREMLQAIHDGSKTVPLVCTACASAGLVIGSIALSGVGFKFVSAVLAISGGVPFLALILVAAISLILGMGLPTTGRPGVLRRSLHRGLAAQQDGFRRLQAGDTSLHSPLRFHTTTLSLIAPSCRLPATRILRESPWLRSSSGSCAATDFIVPARH